MKLIKTHRRNPGDGKSIPKEELLSEIKFYKHKLNNRPKPADKNRVLFITCFSEFGCESLALMYCIPKIIQQNPGAYVICVGWFGRKYLYKHLVDEYWEIHEEFQYFREQSQAFKHCSKNLEKLEDNLKNMGHLYPGSLMGNICLGSTCNDCYEFLGKQEKNTKCEKCGSENVDCALFDDIDYFKKLAVRVPSPSFDVQNKAQSYLKPNSVGIFARGRLCYGRNLRSEFYEKMIINLEKQGYNPIWLGEKQSVLPCPVSHITDFSRLPESRNLELTMAIIAQLKFTIQFWTASTRLSSMMNTPWILFESSDQLYGNGQEGTRIALTTDCNKKKLVISDYYTTLEKEDEALKLVDIAISEINKNNCKSIIGLVSEPSVVKMQMESSKLFKYLK